VESFGWRRLLLCTNRSLRVAGLVSTLEKLLGDCLVAVYDEVQPHVPDFQVDEAFNLAFEKGADAIIGMGGGSPIGMAKATAFRFEEEETARLASSASSIDQPLIPVIAIPTTYAGSEMTPVFGITHTRETPSRKVTVNNPKVTPKLVLYDPRLTIDLPPDMTASTGINALAHCIEALYSITRNPLSTAAAISGVRYITGALLQCYTQGDDLAARTRMLLGAHLAGLSLASVSMGLHHGLCHVLGGTVGVSHGIANSIILPHAIRFNAETTSAELMPAAEAMSIVENGRDPVVVIEEMADRIFALTGQMDLPQRLRDAGVNEADLLRIAEIAFQSRTIHNNPRQIQSALQIENLLREAW
jgi:maleylacetate reductase